MSEATEQVRRFNRLVTERVGVLNDRFLGLSRPLGEARLLWEIGSDGVEAVASDGVEAVAPDGVEVRQLRTRLGLDSGYLSRLLGALQADGLLTVGPST